MCTTSQYVYACLHTASYRFRTSICRNPAKASCRIRDENCFLPYSCPKCAGKLRLRNGKLARERITGQTDPNTMIAKMTWHVPSRCFIDTGFRNLNPFGTEVEKSSEHRAGPGSSLSHICKVPPTVNERSADGGQPRQSSPCCTESTRTGAYQATRLEGVRDRRRGRIVDSFCGSWW